MNTTHDLQLFVAMWRPLVAREQLAPLIDEHIAFMNALEAEGILFASGPFMDGDFEGMSIVRATSADAAKRIFDREPWYMKGLRTCIVREWRLKEGAL